MQISCTHADVFALARSGGDTCAIVSAACAETQSLVNFYKLYYCYVNSPFLMTLILLLCVGAVFIFIFETVDEYVVPAIVSIVATLRLSNALAGVTLLAFANGIGDVITALVASGTAEAVSYNVGGVCGAGLFVMTVVVFFTVELSPKTTVLPKSVMCRDLGLYAAATTYLIFCAFKGEITFADSILIIGLYFGLVVMVGVQDWFGLTTQVPVRRQSTFDLNPIDDEDLEKFVKRRATHSENDFVQRKSLKRALSSLSSPWNASEVVVESTEKQNYAAKVVTVIDFPMKHLRRVTIPPCNEEFYSKKLALSWPFLGLPFLFWVLGATTIRSWALCLLLALVTALGLQFYAPAYLQKSPGFFFCLNTASVIVSVLWTKVASEVLIDSLSFTGLMANLSSTYLGLTVIAVGSALPDGITTIALARNGQAVLGITGGYAGQIFGLLVGFGSAMAKRTFTTGQPVAFALFRRENLRQNALLILVLITGLFVMILTISWTMLRKQRLEKKLGRILCAAYTLFLAICTALSLKDAVKTF